MLTFFSASTDIVNSEKAIIHCIEKALEPIFRLNCNLLVIHSSIGHDFPSLLAKAKALLPHATVLGCTCAGVVGTEGANENMRALAVMAVVAEKASEIAVTYCDNIRGFNSYEQAKEKALKLKDENEQINMTMLLASGIDIAADRAIQGIENVFGPEVPIFGGTSSDNSKVISSFQFFDEHILERGAVMVGFADASLSLVSGATHGNTPLGMPFTVTKSEANRVFELDGEPAWPFLMQKLNLPASTHPGSTIPIAGIGEQLGEELAAEYGSDHILRVIVKVDKTHQSFYMPVDCPEGTQLWLTKRDESLIFDRLDVLMASLESQIGDRNIAAIFHTDCVARGRHLLNKISKDEIVNRMQRPLMGEGQLPWLGMYGFGEFTLLGNRNHFHNYTTSIYALVRA